MKETHSTNCTYAYTVCLPLCAGKSTTYHMYCTGESAVLSLTESVQYHIHVCLEYTPAQGDTGKPLCLD